MTVNLEDAYKSSPKTAVIIINDNELISFVLNFCYLGSFIVFLIDNTLEVKSRITKASKAMGALEFIWKSLQI